MRVFTYLLFGALAACADAAKSLPAGMPVCKRKDPNVNECVRSAIEKSMPYLLSGDQGLGVSPLDPMKVDHIDIDKKKNDGRPVDVDLTFKDVTIKGISSANINSAVADWDNQMVSFEATSTGPIEIMGRYVTDGVVLILPITGDGDFNIKIEGFKAHIKVHGKDTVRDGEKFMDVDRLSFTFDADHMTMRFENLFNGQAELAEKMNSFLNENWKDIMTEMTPAIEASFSNTFKTVAEKVFNQVPIDKIALP